MRLILSIVLLAIAGCGPATYDTATVFDVTEHIGTECPPNKVLVSSDPSINKIKCAHVGLIRETGK